MAKSRQVLKNLCPDTFFFCHFLQFVILQSSVIKRPLADHIYVTEKKKSCGNIFDSQGTFSKGLCACKRQQHFVCSKGF